MAVLVIAACSSDPYPLLTPAGASFSAARGLGEPVRSVVLYLQPRPGDRIELIDASAPGLADGATVRFYYSPPVADSDGTRTIGEDLRPVSGAAVIVDPAVSPGPDNDVGIVAELTAQRPGTYEIAVVRLSFRRNGGAVETKEGISQTLRLCATDPPPTDPTDCAPPDDG